MNERWGEQEDALVGVSSGTKPDTWGYMKDGSDMKIDNER